MTGLLLRHDKIEFLPVQSKIRHQRLKCRFHTVLFRLSALIFQKYRRVQDQIIHFLAGGKNRPVPVIDISPLIRKQDTVRILLCEYPSCILFSADSDDIHQPAKDPGKDQYDGDK